MIRLKKVLPSELDGEMLSKIIELNRSKFEISTDLVEQVLKEKHIIHLYTDDELDKLIGVIGFRRDKHNDAIYLYIGGSVVHDDYQKAGILSKSLLHEIMITYIMYPFNRKYALAFCTTPEAYQYFCSLNSWPCRHSATPEKLLKAQKEYLPVIGVDEYEEINSAIVCHKLKGKIKELNPSKCINKEIEEYFNSLIKCDNEGSQVLCMTEFNCANFYMVTKKRILKKLRWMINYIRMKLVTIRK